MNTKTKNIISTIIEIIPLIINLFKKKKPKNQDDKN